MGKSKAQRKIQKRKEAALEARINARIDAKIDAFLRGEPSLLEDAPSRTIIGPDPAVDDLFGPPVIVEDEEQPESRPEPMFPPVFLVDEAPKAKHLRLARERGVNLVVLLTTDHHVDMLDSMAWERRHIPRLPDVHCVDVGDPSFIPFIKEQWIEYQHNDLRRRLDRRSYRRRRD